MAPILIGSWARTVPAPRTPTAASSALYFMFVSSRFGLGLRHADLVRGVCAGNARNSTLTLTRRDYRRWPRRSGGDPSPIWIIVLGRTTSGTEMVNAANENRPTRADVQAA